MGSTPMDMMGGMAGMGMMGGMGGMGMPGGLGMPAAATGGLGATQVICLANMLSIEELASDEYDEVATNHLVYCLYLCCLLLLSLSLLSSSKLSFSMLSLSLSLLSLQIVSDIRDECSTFGTIEELFIPRPAADGSAVPGIGKAFIKFTDALSAQKVFAYILPFTAAHVCVWHCRQPHHSQAGPLMDKKLRARTYQMKCLQHAPSKLCHEKVGEFGRFIDKLNIYLLQFYTTSY